MKKIVIINSIKEDIYYLKYLIDGIVESRFEARESLRETLQNEPGLLTKEPCIAIVEFNMPGFKSYLELLASCERPIQTIVTYKNSQEDFANESILYSPNVQKFNIEKGQVTELTKSLNTLSKLSDRVNKTSVYCKVKIDYFLKTKSLICDAYLQISEDKYLKIINRHENYNIEDVEKYITKGVSYLFIKENDFKVFVNGMVKDIQKRQHSNLPSLMTESKILSLSCLETVHEIVHKMGINPQALFLTNESINNTLNLVQKTNLLKLLKDTIGKGSYMSEISLLSNYISCAICKESEWASSDNYLRLSLASFFQNISLQNDEHAKIFDIHNEEFNLLLGKTKKSIIDHPNRSVEYLASVKGLPIGVDKIIKSHHEQYNGKGFPRGIDYTRIDPLSTIFIVSLEYATILFDIGFNRDSMISTIFEMEEKYTKGSFAKVIEAMKKAFSVPLIETENREFFND